MKLTIRGHNITIQDETRDYIERRMRFAVGRFTSRIRSARIVVRDANGPRGGVDKICSIEVQLERIGPVLASGEHHDLLTAIDLACSRLDRLVGRELAKLRPASEDKARSREIAERLMNSRS